MADRAGADHRAARLVAIAEAASERAACRVLRAGAGRHAVVGRAVTRSVASTEPGQQVSGAAAVDLPFRAFPAGDVGVCRIPGLVLAARGGVLHHCARPGSVGKALFLPRAVCSGQRRLCEELHRSGSGVFALRGGAGLSGRDVAAGRPVEDGPAVLRVGARPGRQHDVRCHIKNGAGHDADHAGDLPAASLTLARRGLGPVRHGAAVDSGMVHLAAFAQYRRQDLYRLSRDNDPEQRERYGLAADLLGQVAEILRGRAGHRTWYRFDARPVREGRGRRDRCEGHGGQRSA